MDQYDFLHKNNSNNGYISDGEKSNNKNRDRGNSEITLKDLATLAPKDNVDNMSLSSFGDDTVSNAPSTNFNSNVGDFKKKRTVNAKIPSPRIVETWFGPKPPEAA